MSTILQAIDFVRTACEGIERSLKPYRDAVSELRSKALTINSASIRLKKFGDVFRAILNTKDKAENTASIAAARCVLDEQIDDTSSAMILACAIHPDQSFDQWYRQLSPIALRHLGEIAGKMVDLLLDDEISKKASAIDDWLIKNGHCPSSLLIGCELMARPPEHALRLLEEVTNKRNAEEESPYDGSCSAPGTGRRHEIARQERVARRATTSLPEWVGEYFRGHQYKLIKELHSGGEKLITDLLMTIYGCTSSKMTALERIVHRTNVKLAKFNIGFEIKIRRSEVCILVPLENA